MPITSIVCNAMRLFFEPIIRPLCATDANGKPVLVTAVSNGGLAISNAGANDRATSQTTSTGSAVQLAAAREKRRSIKVTNLDSSNNIAVGSSGVTFGTGDIIPPQTSIVYSCVKALYLIDDNVNHCAVSVTDEFD